MVCANWHSYLRLLSPSSHKMTYFLPFFCLRKAKTRKLKKQTKFFFVRCNRKICGETDGMLKLPKKFIQIRDFGGPSHIPLFDTFLALQRLKQPFFENFFGTSGFRMKNCVEQDGFQKKNFLTPRKSLKSPNTVSYAGKDHNKR